MTPLARAHALELERAEPDAAQAAHLVPDVEQHAANLSVAALAQHHVLADHRRLLVPDESEALLLRRLDRALRQE